MATEALKKFAEELKFIRESKEISLQQIANKTKIDIKFLQAIENANFDILPDIYVKAFMKEYAQQVGLDSNETVKKYERSKIGRSEQPEQTQPVLSATSEPVIEKKVGKEFVSVEPVSAQIPTTQTESNKRAHSNYIYGGVIILLVLILLYMIFIKGSSPDIISESPAEESVTQNNSRFEVEKPNQVNEPEKPVLPTENNDSLRIRLQTNGRVWVKVSADGKILNQQVVQPESNLNYSASKYFSVSVGNAGLVKLFFNDKPVSNIGNPGEIRNIFLSADTIRYITIAPQNKNEKKPTTTN